MSRTALLVWPDHPLPATDTHAAYVEVLARHEGVIRHLAQCYARGDATLVDDLAQAARIWLWDEDVTRFDDADSRDEKYLCQGIGKAIRRGRAREWRQAGGIGNRTKEEVVDLPDGEQRIGDVIGGAGLF